jgi:hypothetical protein
MFQVERSEPSKERETLSGEPTQEGVVTVPVADLKRLREQVTELQKRGTELVEENRRLKAESGFIGSWLAFSRETHDLAASKGWWDDEKILDGVMANVELVAEGAGATALVAQIRARIIDAQKMLTNLKTFTALGLVMSEVSEGIEGQRVNAPSTKILGFLNIEEELGDAVIRIMDLSYTRGWRVAEAILAKHSYNKSRPFRHGGKAA